MVFMKPEHQRREPEIPAISIVQFALSYARNGWSVFPLHNKNPFEFIMPDVKSHGYKDATTDPEEIRAFWTYHPGATIGLATGSVSGVIVLDIDPPEGHYSLKELQRKYDPPTGHQEKQYRK